MPTHSRKFTVVAAVAPKSGRKAKVGGLFHGKSPRMTAKKAMTSICRKSRLRGPCSLHIDLKEVTPKSAGKIFRYSVLRKKLAKGKEVVIPGQPPRKYEVRVKSLKSRKTAKKSRKTSRK
jgi:hypothetical protein